MNNLVKHLPKCSCKCRRAASGPATLNRARKDDMAVVAGSKPTPVTTSAAAGSTSKAKQTTSTAGSSCTSTYAASAAATTTAGRIGLKLRTDVKLSLVMVFTIDISC